jgi:hypothetical protein
MGMGARTTGALVVRDRRSNVADRLDEESAVAVIMGFCVACGRTVYLPENDDPQFCPVCCSTLAPEGASSPSVEKTASRAERSATES